MGALSLAAILAIALAALRGTAGALTDWRQRRMEAAAEAAPLRAARIKLQEAQMRADAAGAGSGARVPSSNEYGRRALARTGSGGGGSGGGRGGGSTSAGRTGSGAGRSPASTSGGRTGSGSSRTGSPSGSGGTGPGRKGGGSGSGSGSSGSGSGGKGKGSSGSGSGGGGKAGGSGSGSKGSTSTGSGGSSSGSSGTATRKPGVLGQLALDGSKRRTARQAAAQKEAARKQKAEHTERKRAAKTGDGADSSDGSSSGTDSKRKGKDGKTDDDTTSADTDRVTLGKALGDEARRRAEERLKRRREDLDPPFLRRVPRDGAETAEGAAATTTEGDTTGTGSSGPETPAGGPTTTGPATGPTTGPSSAGTGASGGPGAGWEFYEPPGGGGRRNPWDSLFEAMWDAEVVWTVEQVDPPGTYARRWEPEAIGPAPAGLPPSPSPAGTSAGTTSPTMTKETRVSAPLIPTPRMAAGVASEHLTDVTLDDVLKSLAKSKTDCFATYDECADLAEKARELRDQLRVLAEELAQRHNVIGRMTSAAMARLSESMDLMARKADAMRGESLHAAESVEVAHDEMHDAYKPVQQAAADAGLVMPSARIHNED